MNVIYIDSLFFLNFAIDYLLLLATGKICALPLRRPRMVLGAIFGGIYAICTAIAPEFFSLWTVKLLAGAAVAVLAFGGSDRIARTIVVFFAVSAAFGGAVWCVLTLDGTPAKQGFYVPVSTSALFLSFAVCYAVLSLVFRYSGRRVERSLCLVCVTLARRKAEFTALVDTGNELIDPVSGCPVVVAETGALAPLFDREELALLRRDPTESFAELASRPALRGRLRLLPCGGAAGADTLLLCLRPDETTVDGRKQSRVVAVTPRKLSPDNSYHALL